ncbi:MAG: aspartate/glutamate racemase family protein [Alphaproteobacteria bacterium]
MTAPDPQALDSHAPPANARTAHGGKAVYGARLGILMLEARFPRIPGDMGNAGTWPFPVLYRVVKDASPERVVIHKAAGMLPAFLDAARDLVEMGADGITTNCGFLSIYQREIAAHVGVPVATSSLMQAPFIQSVLPPGRRVGILTISARTLLAEHLAAAGVSPDTPVIGTEDGREFSRAIIGNLPTLDVAAAEQDILDAGRRLVAQNPDVGAVLLECTNMSPYARALGDALRLPVYDIYSFITWFHAGLGPRDFGHPASAARAWGER